MARPILSHRWLCQKEREKKKKTEVSMRMAKRMNARRAFLCYRRHEIAENYYILWLHGRAAIGPLRRWTHWIAECDSFFFFSVQLTRDAAHNAYIDIKDAYSEHSHFHIVSQRIYRQLHRKRINNNKRNGQINDFDLKLHTLHFVDWLRPCSLLVSATSNFMCHHVDSYNSYIHLLNFFSVAAAAVGFISMSNDTGHCIVHRSGRINGIRNNSEHKKHAHIVQWAECIHEVR